MMQDAINAFATQFNFRPKIENASKLRTYKKFVILGMGGSNQAPSILKIRDPFLDIISHRDYGIPKLSPEAMKGVLFIASSYSGNTEEAIDGFHEVRKRGLPLAVIATGGKLLDRAKHYKVPYVAIPKTGIQPRSALGFQILGLTALMRQTRLTRELAALSSSLKPRRFEIKGKALAKKLKGRVPLIYASTRNAAIALIWKIKFNETGKIPAFAHAVPELNHNEMTGFDAISSTKKLTAPFHVLFIKGDDHLQIRKRMDVTAKLYKKRGLSSDFISLSDFSFKAIFESLLLADWAAFYTAELYGTESEQVPMVEEFKKLIS
jgi:glucose/mannose-6-phosphate isomerase